MVISENGTSHTFRVYLPEAARVELVGTFTSWRAGAVKMTREDTGWWSATLDIRDGEHDFSYLVDGSTWLADYAASGVKRNGFGGWVSQLHVGEAKRPDVQMALRFTRSKAA
jgi:1,4-alpha-glucan branching enzyme